MANAFLREPSLAVTTPDRRPEAPEISILVTMRRARAPSVVRLRASPAREEATGNLSFTL